MKLCINASAHGQYRLVRIAKRYAAWIRGDLQKHKDEMYWFAFNIAYRNLK